MRVRRERRKRPNLRGAASSVGVILKGFCSVLIPWLYESGRSLVRHDVFQQVLAQLGAVGSAVSLVIASDTFIRDGQQDERFDQASTMEFEKISNRNVQ